MKVVCIARHGNKCANVRRGKITLSFPIYEIGIYEARARKADGVLTWRRAGAVSGTQTACQGQPSDALWGRALKYAEEAGIPLVHVRHGTPVTDSHKAEIQRGGPLSDAWNTDAR
jgi:hypothetical protein